MVKSIKEVLFCKKCDSEQPHYMPRKECVTCKQKQNAKRPAKYNAKYNAKQDYTTKDYQHTDNIGLPEHQHNALDCERVFEANVYRLEHQPTGKFYFGSTLRSLANRKSRHFADAKRGAKSPLRALIRERIAAVGEDAAKAEFTITGIWLTRFINTEVDKGEVTVKLERIEGGYIDGHIDDDLCLNAQTVAADDDLKVPQYPLGQTATSSTH